MKMKMLKIKLTLEKRSREMVFIFFFFFLLELCSRKSYDGLKKKEKKKSMFLYLLHCLTSTFF